MDDLELLTFEVTDEIAGQRLDKVLTDKLDDYSRMQVQQLIKNGLVMVNERERKASHKLEIGEMVVAQIPPEEEAGEIEAQNIPLEVLYEDEYIAAINKPAGLVVHPGFGNTEGTMVNALLSRWPQVRHVGHPERAGVVHRLDKETSGVILVALTPKAQYNLMRQFEERTVKKIYWTLVDRRPDTSIGRIHAPIGRDPQQRKKMAVVKHGREAITNFRVMQNYQEHALIEIHLETGRTHQIRVHMAFVGCPVVGDTIYGFRKPSLKIGRMFLHAKSIAFRHPITNAEMAFETELPTELQQTLDKLAQQ